MCGRRKTSKGVAANAAAARRCRRQLATFNYSATTPPTADSHDLPKRQRHHRHPTTAIRTPRLTRYAGVFRRGGEQRFRRVQLEGVDPARVGRDHARDVRPGDPNLEDAHVPANVTLV